MQESWGKAKMECSQAEVQTGLVQTHLWTWEGDLAGLEHLLLLLVEEDMGRDVEAELVGEEEVDGAR